MSVPAIAQAVGNAVAGTCIESIGAENLEQGSDQNGHSWMILPLRVVGPNAAQIKKKIVKSLENLEIETRPVLTGNFLAQPAMKTISHNSQKREDFPVATMIRETAFMVGAHYDLTIEQIQFLCDALKRTAIEIV